jgi:hypothetical protein
MVDKAEAAAAAEGPSLWCAARQLLASSTLGDLMAHEHAWTPRSRLLTLRGDVSCGDAAAALAAARVLSAPVLSPEDGALQGVAEVRSLMRAFMRLHGARRARRDTLRKRFCDALF